MNNQIRWRASFVLKEFGAEVKITDERGSQMTIRGWDVWDWMAIEYKLVELRATGSKVQSVLCSKKRFKTAAAARKWCKSHKFHTKKLDETSNFYRFRQFPPGKCTGGTHGTINLTQGVQAHVCVPKE